MNIMARQVKLALIIAITNLLLGVYYLFVGFRLSVLFSQFNAEAPNPIFNKYLIGFLVLAMLSFSYWYFLKRKEKRELGVSKNVYNLILLILSGPVIYLAMTQIYSLVVIYIIIPLTI